MLLDARSGCLACTRGAPLDRLLRPVHRWVWGDFDRRVRKLLAFAEVEADGGRDILRAAGADARSAAAAALSRARDRRAAPRRSVPRARRGAAARARGARRRAVQRQPAARRPRPRRSARSKASPTHRLLAFLHVAEKAAAGRFAIYRELVDDDPATRAIFEEILRDEVFHMNYTYTQLARISPRRYRRQVWRARAQPAVEALPARRRGDRRRSSATAMLDAHVLRRCCRRSPGWPDAPSGASRQGWTPIVARPRDVARRASTDMKILGISAHYHDSAAALLVDGVPVAPCRKSGCRAARTTPAFRCDAIEWCLDRGGLEPDDLDAVVFYERSMLKFERILTCALRAFPRSWRSFPHAMKNSLGEKVWVRGIIASQLGVPRPKILFTDHHASHAAAAFLTAPTRRAAILTADGVGEWATLTVGHGERARRRRDRRSRCTARSASRIRSACSTRPSPPISASR